MRAFMLVLARWIGDVSVSLIPESATETTAEVYKESTGHNKADQN